MSTRTAPPFFRAATVAVLLILAFPFVRPDRVSAQERGTLRVGLTSGGIGLWGIAVEYQFDDVALDLNVATFSFDDLNISLTAKHYFGEGDLRPFVGLGLWGAVGRPEEDPRDGIALLALAPIGADWQALDDHALGAAINVNRGLWIRRSDPQDETPIGTRLIPLPAFYYRYTATR